MSAPILYEINTRVWLRELSERAGHSVNLAEIPENEITRWKELGFTHIWLMGVWQVGPKAREIAVKFWREQWRKEDRKSTRLNSSHSQISYAVFCLKKKKK